MWLQTFDCQTAENEKSKASVKCLFYLIWTGHLTYRSNVYRSEEVTPLLLTLHCRQIPNLFDQALKQEHI